ncbi:MAG: TetR/AcrR family transcriptional regulator, partial [Clostridiales bacterium]|nr:TetR/AcrR family transcriptional regulator [Clostridiales bacterium]
QNTTMGDILKAAGCSKGRFYYYFHAKGELLDSLYEVFDKKYEEFFDMLDSERDAYDRLLALNRFMFDFMSEQIGVELLRSLYISQLSGTTGIGFWGENRSFRKILTRIVEDGVRNGELRTDIGVYEMVSDMIAEERSQLISWCLDDGKYPLTENSMPRLERFYIGYLKNASHVSSGAGAKEPDGQKTGTSA